MSMESEVRGTETISRLTNSINAKNVSMTIFGY